MSAPKPAARADGVSLWRYLKLFRQDILSAQPDKLYRAKMAEFRTPFFRSFLINQPDLVQQVLVEEPERFPKSARVTAGLRPLLGQSVFVTNGETWKRQRRIIDPAFSGGRLKQIFPEILRAAKEASTRLADGPFDVEPFMSRIAADVIFRTMFSRSIDDALAAKTYAAFQTYQRSQPVLTPAAFVPGLPARLRRKARLAAEDIRQSLRALIEARRDEMAAGHAQDDLVTKLMSGIDPETGKGFSDEELLDQIAIFFLAGHETSASTLAWALWLLADAPDWAERVAEEGRDFATAPTFAALSKLPVTRNVVQETLRLYPPVPMMVREAAEDHVFRKREVKAGSQIVISPWHIHRHEAHWDDADDFRPDRWEDLRPREAHYLPFSAGPRICPGAGFAMTEAVVVIATLMGAHVFRMDGSRPTPVAHLTVRSRDGIRLIASRRNQTSSSRD